jgi:hypothetical protein
MFDVHPALDDAGIPVRSWTVYTMALMDTVTITAKLLDRFPVLLQRTPAGWLRAVTRAARPLFAALETELESRGQLTARDIHQGDQIQARAVTVEQRTVALTQDGDPEDLR